MFKHWPLSLPPDVEGTQIRPRDNVKGSQVLWRRNCSQPPSSCHCVVGKSSHFPNCHSHSAALQVWVLSGLPSSLVQGKTQPIQDINSSSVFSNPEIRIDRRVLDRVHATLASVAGSWFTSATNVSLWVSAAPWNAHHNSAFSSWDFWLVNKHRCSFSVPCVLWRSQSNSCQLFCPLCY